MVRRRRGEPRVEFGIGGGGCGACGDRLVGVDVHAVVFAQAHEDVFDGGVEGVFGEAGGHFGLLEEKGVGGVVRDLVRVHVSKWERERERGGWVLTSMRPCQRPANVPGV